MQPSLLIISLPKSHIFTVRRPKALNDRMGGAWLLMLCSELYRQDSESKRWADMVEPLANLIRDRFLDFFEKADYPMRAGESRQ